MVTIKKAGMKFEFPNDAFVTTQDTPTGMYFKFKDGTELILNAEKNPQFKTIPGMLMKSQVKNIVLDFDDPKNLVSLTQ